MYYDIIKSSKIKKDWRGCKVSYINGAYGYVPPPQYQGQYAGYQPQSQFQGYGGQQMGYMNQQQPAQQQRFVCRPVTNFEEANASPVEFDGTMSVFVDLAHSRIYTKQMLLDGSSDLRTYKLDETKQNSNAQSEQNKYVLQSDFENVINNITQQIGVLMGGMKNVGTDGNEHAEEASNVSQGGANGAR